MLDKLITIHVARVFFLELIGNRSEQEVQFGPDVFINQLSEHDRPDSAKEIYFHKSKE
jgi:hypothetical protein